MSYERYNAYRTMWVLVLFDLPTNTKNERKTASRFRKNLLKNGFAMFQFSIYLRHCPSKENANVHIKRVKQNLPQYGQIGVLCITDKQFGRMEIYHEQKEKNTPNPSQQLEMF